MELTEPESLRANERMLNTLIVEALEPYLADDFVYESQMVLMAVGQLTVDTSNALGACREAAAKTKKEQHCILAVRRRDSLTFAFL
jgi:hypothetical protein